MPKSLGVATSGEPKWCIQTRLTSTRAVSGFFRSTMARASSSLPEPCWKGSGFTLARSAGSLRGTGSPRLLGFPRRNTRGSTGSGRILQADGPGRRAWALDQPVLNGVAELLELRLRGSVGQERQVAEGSHRQVRRGVRAVENLAKLLERGIGQRGGLASGSARAAARLLPDGLDLVEASCRRSGPALRASRGDAPPGHGPTEGLIERAGLEVVEKPAHRTFARAANSLAGKPARACQGAKTGSCPLRVRAR